MICKLSPSFSGPDLDTDTPCSNQGVFPDFFFVLPGGTCAVSLLGDVAQGRPAKGSRYDSYLGYLVVD